METTDNELPIHDTQRLPPHRPVMQDVHDLSKSPNIEVHLGPRQVKSLRGSNPRDPSSPSPHTRFQLMKFFLKSQDRNSLPSPTAWEHVCKGALSRTTSAAGASIPAAEMSAAPLVLFSVRGVSGVAARQVGLSGPEKTRGAHNPTGVGLAAPLVTCLQWISVLRYPGGSRGAAGLVPTQ
jgi:hypothetical protein